MEIRVRPVDDGYTKLFVDGKEIYYNDNDDELIEELFQLLDHLGANVIKEDHECTICEEPCDCW